MNTLTNLEELENTLKNNVFTILKFSTEMFDICKEISPFFKEISKKSEYSNICFSEINPDISFDIYRKYKVSCLPTFILFEKDENTISGYREIHRFRGSNKEDLLKMIDMCFN